MEIFGIFSLSLYSCSVFANFSSLDEFHEKYLISFFVSQWIFWLELCFQFEAGVGFQKNYLLNIFISELKLTERLFHFHIVLS